MSKSTECAVLRAANADGDYLQGIPATRPGLASGAIHRAGCVETRRPVCRARRRRGSPRARVCKALRPCPCALCPGRSTQNDEAGTESGEVISLLYILHSRQKQALITFLFQQQKDKTAGPGWFDLPAPDAADLPRLYREVEALRLRNALDPKRFYRKEEGEGKGIKGLPKHFAVRIWQSR